MENSVKHLSIIEKAIIVGEHVRKNLKEFNLNDFNCLGETLTLKVISEGLQTEEEIADFVNEQMSAKNKETLRRVVVIATKDIDSDIVVALENVIARIKTLKEKGVDIPLYTNEINNVVRGVVDKVYNLEENQELSFGQTLIG